MNKIIAAIDGLKYAHSTTWYGVQVAKETASCLVGVFLDDSRRHSYKIYELLDDDGVSEKKRTRLDAGDITTRETAARLFEAACKNAGISYLIHHNRKHALQELLNESLYADLVIINKTETFTANDEEIPASFIRRLLKQLQCPVLLVPAEYTPFDKLVFLYDGSPSSMHAIKMFGYMFPAMKVPEAEVIMVKNVKSPADVPGHKLLKEFMKKHYPKTGYTLLRGIPETAIVKHLQRQKGHPVLVAGAYHRGAVSNWLKHSMADILLQQLELPLFVAHI